MCLIGNSAHAAVRGGMSAHRLVHTQANQLNRFELTFASFHFNRFAAAHLRGIQPVAVDRFNHASFPVPLIMTRLPVVIALRLRSYVIMVFSPL